MSDATIDLDQVRAEIAVEVRRRRLEGDFDAAKERELERLFHQYAPVQGRTGALGEALRGVDAAAYINPLVPVESNQPAGAVIKKSMRKAGLWYAEWLTGQMTRSVSSIARALHLIDDELTELRARMDLVAVSGAPVIELEGRSGPESWWTTAATAAVASIEGRVLVAACGDGWLVQGLLASQVDAYGIDSRAGKIMEAETAGLDLRDEDLLEHLASVADDRLSGIILTGSTEALLPAQRRTLLDLLAVKLAPRSVVVLHSAHPDAMAGDALPAELDLAGGRPLRPMSWARLLEALGYSAMVEVAGDGRDALIIAVRGTGDFPAR